MLRYSAVRYSPSSATHSTLESDLSHPIFIKIDPSQIGLSGSTEFHLNLCDSSCILPALGKGSR